PVENMRPALYPCGHKHPNGHRRANNANRIIWVKRIGPQSTGITHLYSNTFVLYYRTNPHLIIGLFLKVIIRILSGNGRQKWLL
ncbi:MAG: hypothetical protein B1H08_02055, partial [Candidatus Omnitrophica bacterium 4484_171]